MKKDRVIRVQDRLSSRNGERSFDTTSMGCLTGGEDDYTLIYDEEISEGDLSRVSITVKDQSFASVVRSGRFAAELIMEPGKRHSSRYNTPFGDLMIGVYATDVYSAMSSKGGRLELSYTVDCNGSLLATKHVVIDVSDKLRR